ncbi:hypothetical protein B0H10DRAFT_2210052 [Mycena sp. CBHHK59/15]|nr:hypothetical protein B0H10DRAFT_2210052 [Mycena sp. CBHHK59/15]
MSALPPELELRIFVSVAKASPYDAALRLRLMLVAQRVRIWVEPFIYHILIFSRSNSWSRLKRNKTIGLSGEARQVDLYATLHSLHARSIRVSPIPDPAHHLAHLELVFWKEFAEHHPATVDLARFAHLTHLALRCDDDRFLWPLGMVSSALSTCRGLKILVLVDYDIGLSEFIRRSLNDRRVIVVLSDVALHDWEAPPGKTDMWAKASQVGDDPSFRTVAVRFHDHPNLVIPDYFTGLGYLLSLQDYGSQDLGQRIKLLALYAKICKLSSPLVQSRPPTTVQLLWVNTPHPSDTRVALGSSLAWLKVRSHFQMARNTRGGFCAAFPNPVGALFGTCWGDCAEAISLSALWKLVSAGTPLGTLALNVASMNAVDPKTGLSACDVILANSALSLRSIAQLLARTNALRPMCKNCDHLRNITAADIVDCARSDFWMGILDASGPSGVLARA